MGIDGRFDAGAAGLDPALHTRDSQAVGPAFRRRQETRPHDLMVIGHLLQLIRLGNDVHFQAGGNWLGIIGARGICVVIVSLQPWLAGWRDKCRVRDQVAIGDRLRKGHQVDLRLWHRSA